MQSSSSENTFDRVLKVLSKVPLPIYVMMIFIFVALYFFTSRGLNTYNKYIHKSKEEEKEEVIFKDKLSRFKYIELEKLLGEPDLIETNSNLHTESVTWRLDFDKYDFKYGKYNGLDYIRLNGHVARKHHPIPAPVFVVVGKYINVPEHLYGPLKYASPTINIEQIYIPKKHNLHYEKTGEKKISLVTGSCASVTISAITIKFIEDMIEKYKNDMNISMDLHKKFRKEYDYRVLTYLCGKGVTPNIEWFSPDNFNEDSVYDSKSDKCNLLKNDTNKVKIPDESTIIKSIDNNINHGNLTENDIKNLFKYSGGKSCDKYSTDGDCNSDNDCYWEKGECKKKVCEKIKDKKTCDTYAAECYWDNLNEENKCSRKPS